MEQRREKTAKESEVRTQQTKEMMTNRRVMEGENEERERKQRRQEEGHRKDGGEIGKTGRIQWK